MQKNAPKPWIRRIVSALTFGLLLVGLFYAGYVNELLKGAIPGRHRGVLIIGFIVGVGAASSYLGVALAKRMTSKNNPTGR